MDEQELINTLNYLRDLPGETEIVEFKEAKNNFDFSDIGEYFSALTKFGRSKRSGIEELLWDKLPDILTDKQKKNKVTNLLSALRDEGKIKNEGYSEWILIYKSLRKVICTNLK